MAGDAVVEMGVSGDIRIDKGDLTAIAVAEAEVRIKNMLIELERQHKKASDEYTQVCFEIERLGMELLEKKLQPKIVGIEAGIKTMKVPNLRTNKVFTVGVASYKSLPQDRNRRVVNNPNRYTVSIGFETNKVDYLNPSMEVLNGVMKATAAQVALQKKMDTLQEKRQEIQNQQLDWRRKLSDIPSLERQFKAQLAKDTLGQNKVGKEMIDKLLRNLDGSVNLLGL